MVVVTKQRKDNTLEVYSIPEDILKNYLIDSDGTTPTTDGKELVDLYKMEYEICVKRYDDLYAAAWTNFSYIALIAGAILTFGSDSFMTELSIFVATLPLLFWWIATFEPLNRYGDQVQARAACIEKLLNESIGIVDAPKPDQQQHWLTRWLAGLLGHEAPPKPCEKGLRHFQLYSQRQFEKIRWPKFLIVAVFWIALTLNVINKFDFSTTKACIFVLFASLFLWLIIQSLETPRRLWQVLRVRFIVRIFAGILIMVAIGSAYQALEKHQQKEPFVKSSKSDSKLPERLTIKVEK